MKKQKKAPKTFTASEEQLIEQLRRHPDILERVKSILDLAGNKDGPLRTADEVEAMLVDEIRRLGSATMSNWATQAEERVSTELRNQDPTVRSLKKKG